LGEPGVGLPAITVFEAEAQKTWRTRGVLAKLKIKKSLLHGEGIFAYGDVAVVDVEVEGAVVDVDDVAGPLVLVAAVPPPITTWT